MRSRRGIAPVWNACMARSVGFSGGMNSSTRLTPRSQSLMARTPGSRSSVRQTATAGAGVRAAWTTRRADGRARRMRGRWGFARRIRTSSGWMRSRSRGFPPSTCRASPRCSGERTRRGHGRRATRRFGRRSIACIGTNRTAFTTTSCRRTLRRQRFRLWPRIGRCWRKCRRTQWGVAWPTSSRTPAGSADAFPCPRWRVTTGISSRRAATGAGRSGCRRPTWRSRRSMPTAISGGRATSRRGLWTTCTGPIVNSRHTRSGNAIRRRSRNRRPTSAANSCDTISAAGRRWGQSRFSWRT